MKRGIVCLLALLCYAAARVPSRDERHLIMEAHRSVREGVSPSASNMKMMKYSKKLEKQAEKSLTECVFKDYVVTAFSNNVTQNLRVYVDMEPSFTEMIYLYGKDAQFYNLENNTCTGFCTNYKRIVWANSTRVGCAMHKCGAFGTRLQHPVFTVVCQYNVTEEIKDQRPYEEGLSCSKCPPGYKCRHRQCVEMRETGTDMSTIAQETTTDFYL
uniref:SCP domain-containing protein n=1 Tax=Mesocestoides corti TaxID=53468 RepID=A0A5K3FE42_MESCO